MTGLYTPRHGALGFHSRINRRKSPFLVYLPFYSVHTPIHQIDLYPTLCAYSGAKTPPPISAPPP